MSPRQMRLRTSLNQWWHEFLALKQLVGLYEKEYRQFLLLESCVPTRGMYFIGMPVLKRVVIGARCDMDQSYFDHLLRRCGYKDVNVLKAARSPTSYKIEAWNVCVTRCVTRIG
jgi:hypothetical protein